jgi:glycopeptide antibiotics resistance protein
VAINIFGLIPLGFFFNAYLSIVKKTKRATGLTIVLGFVTSLTIEILQSFLPTRDSGTTDLFTNTLGTAIGAVLFVWSMKRGWFGRFGFPSTLLSKT